MVKLRLLPHYFKYLGLVLFMVRPPPPPPMGFVEGISGIPEGSILYKYISPTLESILEVVVSVGILLYFLAKDKYHDELHQQLRIQVLTLVFTVSVILITLIHVISPATDIDAYGVVLGQMFLFLLIRFLVKQADKSPESAVS